MKILFRLLLIILLAGGVVLYLVSRRNNTTLSPQTIDLAVDCSDIEDLVVTSTVTVDLRNLSSRSHRDVSVRLTAFDAAGNVLKEKYTTFDRTLQPNDELSKPVTLPAKTERCRCEVVRSTPIPTRPE